MKNDGLLFWLCMIETAIIVFIHYIVFRNLNGIAICDDWGRMLVLTITDYLLFFAVIMGVIWKWCSAIFVIRLKGYNLLRLLTLIELWMCCKYLDSIVIICAFGVHILIDMEINSIIKNNADVSVNPLDWVMRLKARTKNILSLLLLLIITANIIYILYPSKEVYFFTKSDGKWVYIEFQHSDNLSECENNCYVFRHYFILGEIDSSTGKKYEISSDRTGDATVQIGKGPNEKEKFYDYEKIVYKITPSYRFDEYLTASYIMKVYAFNVAIIETCVIGLLFLWGFRNSHKKRSKREADTEIKTPQQA